VGTDRSPTKVAIVGAGKGGIALLELLHQIPDVHIVGITDKDPQAPGLQRARELNIHVAEKVPELISNHGANLILDVTGDPRMQETILSHKRPEAEVVNGPTAKLLWTLVQHESKLEAELFHAEKLAGLGSFAAGIAHDINNPLQLILGLAENLAQEKDINAVQEQAREIIEAVKRTSAICRDLTRYARRHVAQDDAAVNVNQKLDEALKIARYAVTLQDIAVVKQYAPKAVVKGNPDELLHVFVNLITNAVQAMAENGTLTLKSEAADDSVSVTVADTGCGIPKEFLPRIFDPLFTTKPAGKGTGLGLYNVMAVVSKMHGHIIVDSTVGKGTSFKIEFSPAVHPIELASP
jgi:two-component system NtrC family sensor kinase